MEKKHSVRKNVSIPQNLAEFAKKNCLSLSRVLQESLREMEEESRFPRRLLPMPVDNIPQFYLAHQREIDEAAENKENPALALYMSVFKNEAHRLLKGAPPL